MNQFPGNHHFCFKEGRIQPENNRVTLPKVHPEVKPGNQVLWVRATPDQDNPKSGEETVNQSNEFTRRKHQRAILSPILLTGAGSEKVKEANNVSQTGFIKMPAYYTITPVEPVSIQSNYVATVPKSFFPDHEGKAKHQTVQPALFDYDSEVYFVKSPLLWNSGKSFYMLNKKQYQDLLKQYEMPDGDYISDGGQKENMNPYLKLDSGEVLDIEHGEIIEAAEAIETLETKAQSISLEQSRTYFIGVDESGEVVMCNIVA